MESLSENQVERLLDPEQCIAGLKSVGCALEDLVAASLVAEALGSGKR